MDIHVKKAKKNSIHTQTEIWHWRGGRHVYLRLFFTTSIIAPQFPCGMEQSDTTTTPLLQTTIHHPPPRSHSHNSSSCHRLLGMRVMHNLFWCDIVWRLCACEGTHERHGCCQPQSHQSSASCKVYCPQPSDGCHLNETTVMLKVTKDRLPDVHWDHTWTPVFELINNAQTCYLIPCHHLLVEFKVWCAIDGIQSLMWAPINDSVCSTSVHVFIIWDKLTLYIPPWPFPKVITHHCLKSLTTSCSTEHNI